MGLRMIVHFTATNICFNPFNHFSFGFTCSNSNKLLLSKTPSCGIRLKSTPLSLYLSFMATNLHVSQSAPTHDFEATPSLQIGQYDLLIVGPGILGRLVAHTWRQEYPGCQVFGQTLTTDHHGELIEIGISPSLNWTGGKHKFPYVIFCAPPYQSSDYNGYIRLAALSWNGEGSFLFTSSSAPYDCNDNGSCDEDTPVVPIGRSRRTDVLLNAENIVLEFGGSVDAASLSVAILKKKFGERIFLGCDNHPLSRQEIMDLVNQSGKLSKKFEKFIGTNDPLGKKLNNSRTRQEVGWEPKYSSFAHFLETL
ncbi:hypothetical protein Lal_00037512 [Lupinus albus]|nr:hypothetical protein Lal_00037512 [Lupinus albus]